VADIYSIGLKVDSTEVNSAEANLRNLAKSVDSVESGIKKLSTTNAKLGESSTKTARAGRTTAAAHMQASKAARATAAAHMEVAKTAKPTAAAHLSVAAAADRSARSHRNLNSSLGSFSGRIGQTAIQFSQFVGQVKAGTSVAVALSQQIADIGYVLRLPFIGAVISVVSILAGSFITALFSSSGAAEELSKKIKDSTDNLRDLTAAQIDFISIGLRDEINKQTEAFDSAQSALDKNLERIRLLEEDYAGFANGNKTLKRAIDGAKESTLALVAARDTERAALERLLVKQAEYEKAKQGSTDRTKEEIEQASALIERLREQAETYGMSNEQLRLYGINSANLTGAQREIALALHEQITALEMKAAMEREVANDESFFSEIATRHEQDRLKAVERQRQEEEQYLGWHLEFSRQLIAADEEVQRKRRASNGLYLSTAQNVIGALGSAWSAFSDKLNQNNKKSFEANKKFQIGMVAINTAAAIMMELATNPNPYTKWFNTAAIALTGLAQGKNIARQQYGGSSSSSGGAAPAPAAPAQQQVTQTQNSYISINVSGGDAAGANVINALREYYSRGGVLFESDSDQARRLIRS